MVYFNTYATTLGHLGTDGLNVCISLPDGFRHHVVDSSLQVQFPSVFDPASKYLSLIVPAYNEQDRIRSTLDETFR